MNKKKYVVVGSLAALAGLAFGPLAANAFWSAEQSHEYGATTPSYSVAFQFEGANVPLNDKGIQVDASNVSDGAYTGSKNVVEANPESFRNMITELAEKREVRRVIKIDRNVKGLMGYGWRDFDGNITGGYAKLYFNDDGPILSQASTFFWAVESPEQCKDGPKPVEEAKKDARGEYVTPIKPVYRNETKTQFLCLGLTLPEKVGIAGKHKNTATVSGTDATSGETVEASDAWEGEVSKATVDWRTQVDAQLDNPDNRVIVKTWTGLTDIGENPDTFTPSPVVDTGL